MILDNEAALATTVAFDLEAVRPGPGTPIKMICTGYTTAGGALAITTCATEGGTYAALATINVGTSGALVEFELPSNALQYIKATFATGSVYVTLAGNQTAT